MKLNPEIDGDETMKDHTVPFLAWGYQEVRVNNVSLYE